MALSIRNGGAWILIRRAAYESSGLSRAAIDERFGLTDQEFRVEGSLVVIGPLFGGSDDAVTDVIAPVGNVPGAKAFRVTATENGYETTLLAPE